MGEQSDSPAPRRRCWSVPEAFGRKTGRISDSPSPHPFPAAPFQTGEPAQHPLSPQRKPTNAFYNEKLCYGMAEKKSQTSLKF